MPNAASSLPPPLAQEAASAAGLRAGLLDSAMDAVVTVDARQRVVLFNGAAEKIFGWPRDAVIGADLGKLIPQAFRAAHVAHVERFGATGTTSRRMGGMTVLEGLRADGTTFPIDASISQLDTPQGKFFTAIVRDVTERVRAQEELSAFAAAAHAIREEEKTRVARELHDELAQSLTALKMDAMWLREHGSRDANAGARLDDMLQMLDGAVASTRRIAADLRPLLLDDLGLAPAIEWLASSFRQRTGIAVDLSVDDELELGEPYATAVFRIVQESLQNVAKHAQATKVRVAVEESAGIVTLEVADDGRGFDVDAPRRPHALGLMGLRERVQLVKGSVAIESAPGRGTRMQVRIPFGRVEAGA